MHKYNFENASSKLQSKVGSMQQIILMKQQILSWKMTIPVHRQKNISVG